MHRNVRVSELVTGDVITVSNYSDYLVTVGANLPDRLDPTGRILLVKTPDRRIDALNLAADDMISVIEQ